MTEINEKADRREIYAILRGSQLEHLAIVVNMEMVSIVVYKYTLRKENSPLSTDNYRDAQNEDGDCQVLSSI